MQGELNFSEVFGQGKGTGSERETCGRKLLQRLSQDNQFNVLSMFEVLRDEESGICRSPDDAFPTTGSQVSLLGAVGSGKPDCHWFTATPNPRASVFKPFIFTSNARISQHTCSPQLDNDPAKVPHLPLSLSLFKSHGKGKYISTNIATIRTRREDSSLSG